MGGLLGLFGLYVCIYVYTYPVCMMDDEVCKRLYILSASSPQPITYTRYIYIYIYNRVTRAIRVIQRGESDRYIMHEVCMAIYVCIYISGMCIIPLSEPCESDLNIYTYRHTYIHTDGDILINHSTGNTVHQQWNKHI